LKIKLIDAHAAFGGPLSPRTPWVTKKNILAEMKRLVVSKAVVRPILLQSGDFVVANQRLFRNCAGDPKLIPCPLMVPSGAGDLPPEEEQVAKFIKQGARMVWIRPVTDRYNLTETLTGRMFKELADRCLPVLCFIDQVPLADMDMLLRRHSGLRIIGAIGYGQLRIVLPMLKAYPDFYLATGIGAADHDFLPTMEQAGVIHKVLFGTGFPVTEPMMAITQLMYADISERNRRAVGSENIIRLLREVKP